MFRKHYAIFGFILMAAVTFGAGAYAQQLGKTELIHFWIATPAGNVTQPITMRGAGPPVSMAPLSIDLDQRGIMKRLIQPDIEGIGTHWIYNLGKKPVKIRLELVNCSIPVEWKVNANYPYDPETHTFTKPLSPGSSIPNLGIDWIFRIPKDDPSYVYTASGAVIIYNGGLRVTDADTGELLTFIPITIGRGTSNLGSASCCS